MTEPRDSGAVLRDVEALQARVRELEQQCEDHLSMRLAHHMQDVRLGIKADVHGHFHNERAEAAEQERDKWLALFNRSEQFQNGPTKRAEAAEARLTALEAALRDAVQVARNYYMLFHDEKWKAKLESWEAALASPSAPTEEHRDE